jgi:hypothetical protein
MRAAFYARVSTAHNVIFRFHSSFPAAVSVAGQEVTP